MFCKCIASAVRIPTSYLHRYAFSIALKTRKISTCSCTCQKDVLNDSVKVKTAGIIVIGDEILKGQVQDINSQYVAKGFRELGVKLSRVSIVPDCVDLISKEVKLFSDLFDFVITAGGIGPTHDDVTYEGVAAAFGEKLIFHPDIVKEVKYYFKIDDESSPAMKLAHVPESSQVIFGINEEGVKTKFPLVAVRNVYIFPGVPQLLRHAFRINKKNLFATGRVFHEKRLYITLDEVSLATRLNKVVVQMQNVCFGSYPKLFHSYYKVMVVMEADEREASEAAYESLKCELPQECIVEYDDQPTQDAYNKIQRLLLKDGEGFQLRLQESLDILEKCLQEYKPEEIFLCFNGSKDSSAVLHLLHAVVRKHFPKAKLSCLYVRNCKQFPQVELFVDETVKRYVLNVTKVNGSLDFGLNSYLDSQDGLKVCISGTRSTDTRSCNHDIFEKGININPEMKWVCPIFNWRYCDVWHFIRSLYLPYCNLYDRGYSHLGDMGETLPDTRLQAIDERGRHIYLPAFILGEEP